MQRQSDEPGPYSAYSENARWRKGPVVFVTLNVQGSNDNYAHLDVPEDVGAPPYTRPAAEIARQDAEHFARLAANEQWLTESFDYAKSVHALGVMVIWQADPNFNNEQHLAQADEYDGFPEIVGALRTATMAFPGQVALIHGDSHYFKVDQPLTTDSGTVLANFTRVETWGAANLHWISAEIDPTRTDAVHVPLDDRASERRLSSSSAWPDAGRPATRTRAVRASYEATSGTATSPFWRAIRMPSRTQVTQARVFGSSSTTTRQSKHTPIPQNTPRGAPPTVVRVAMCPSASRTVATVSPR